MKYDDSALTLAQHLLQIKAVKLSPKAPFTWASGLKSPIYCDNRVTLSYPAVRTYIRQQFVETIMQNFGKPDVIAGVATGGIAQGALVAQELGLPFVYVRSEKEKNCCLYTLSNYETLIYKAVEEKYVTEEDVESLKEWRKDQQAWSDRWS